MTKRQQLAESLRAEFATLLESVTEEHNEITVACSVTNLITVLLQLRHGVKFAFNQLIDLCAVDYLHYGMSDWETDGATEQGFSRGTQPNSFKNVAAPAMRFAVVYHLLSTVHNQRLRVKVFVDEEKLVVPSAHDVWNVANWFEREAYDLYGILFDGHPDLRRILTDYGFIGHPFRKDFPVSGHVEMRYDALQKKVIYEAVDIEPRVVIPKVIRDDNRYLDMSGAAK